MDLVAAATSCSARFTPFASPRGLLDTEHVSDDRAGVWKHLGALWIACAIGGCNDGSRADRHSAVGGGSAVGSSAVGSSASGGTSGEVDAGSRSGSAGALGDRASHTASSPPASKLTCADLPGAVRTGLQLSADGKTAYYVEHARAGHRREISYSLHAFDLALGTATLIADDVSADVALADDGTAVFTRPVAKFNDIGRRRHALLVMTPGKEATPVTGENDDVGDFALDRPTGTIVFLRGDLRNQLSRMPVAGGKPVKISPISAYHIFGITGDSVFVSQGENVSRRPIAGGAASEIADIHDWRVVGIHGDQLVLLKKSDHTVSTVSVSRPKKRTELAVPTDELTMSQVRDQAYLIARHEDAYEVRDLANVVAPPVLVVRGVRPEEVVRAGDRLVVLASVDSDHDETFGPPDETDLCFVPPGPDPVDVHTRTVPRRLVDVVARLAPLTAHGPLAGATVRFSDEDFLELSASLPADTDLRALGQQTQAQVIQLTARPHLSILIRDRISGRHVVSRWHDGVGAFLVSTGMGDALIRDRTQYPVEVDPAITRIRTFDAFPWDTGDTVCNGTVKNISDHELSNIEVTCPIGYGDYRVAKGKLQPSKLAPGARGTYRVPLGYLGSAGTGLEILVDGKAMPYFNLYGEKRAAQVLAVAAKVHDTAQLDYVTMYSYSTGVYDRDQVLAIHVRASPAFEQGSAETREAAAAKAMSELRALAGNSKRLAGVPRLVILRGDGERVGWTYAKGKLTDGPLRAD